VKLASKLTNFQIDVVREKEKETAQTEEKQE
jgi:hypothetical protein